MKNYVVENLNDIQGVDCPCGITKRAFVSPDNQVATVHMVDISADAKLHYHKKMTEIYVILEAEEGAYMQLDDEQVPVKAFTSIFIKPGCRHKAVGKMKILNMPIPAFDPSDEYFD
jgi:mannose-6-phosphate isomerase-like protein (cupin superfamily)